MLDPDNFRDRLGEDWEWARDNVPFFESDHEDITAAYFFRWQVYRYSLADLMPCRSARICILHNLVAVQHGSCSDVSTLSMKSCIFKRQEHLTNLRYSDIPCTLEKHKLHNACNVQIII